MNFICSYLCLSEPTRTACEEPLAHLCFNHMFSQIDNVQAYTAMHACRHRRNSTGFDSSGGNFDPRSPWWAPKGVWPPPTRVSWYPPAMPHLRDEFVEKVSVRAAGEGGNIMHATSISRVQHWSMARGTPWVVFGEVSFIRIILADVPCHVPIKFTVSVPFHKYNSSTCRVV